MLLLSLISNIIPGGCEKHANYGKLICSNSDTSHVVGRSIRPSVLSIICILIAPAEILWDLLFLPAEGQNNPPPNDIKFLFPRDVMNNKLLRQG